MKKTVMQNSTPSGVHTGDNRLLMKHQKASHTKHTWQIKIVHVTMPNADVMNVVGQTSQTHFQHNHYVKFMASGYGQNVIIFDE